MSKVTRMDQIRRYSHAIERYAGKVSRPDREDGYVNAINRYGTQKDISEQYKYVPEPLVPDEVLAAHYEGNGLFAKIIDAPAEEAVKHGFTLDDITDEKLNTFYAEALDELDSVSIDENQWGEDVTLNAIKTFNHGNNCLHYTLIHDNHRIVIQTYKDLIRKNYVDIVQGNPNLDPCFKDMKDVFDARPQDYTDNRLNKMFILYCSMWQKCTSFYWGEMCSFFCEFGPNINTVWDQENGWAIQCEERIDKVKFVLDFIDAVEDICNG